MEIKSSTITNDDGTIGYITNANKYLYSDDYLKKYKLLELLSDNKNVVRKTVTAGGVKGKDSTEKANTNGPTILNFITKLQKFQFSPPSDNLWTISIDTMDNLDQKKSGLPTLYSAITAANNSWKSIVQTRWEVNMQQVIKNDKKSVQNYIEDFCSQSGIFLAQNINFTTHSATVIDSVFPQAQQHGGFLNFGYIAQNRQVNRSLKVNFLVSNWDIGDILFEPWIAAVAQRGLIQDGSSSIKAKITIKQYSANMPKQYNNNQSFTQMECRKEYIFLNCVPVNRSSIEKSYDFNTAGTFKSIPIEFRYEDYKIKYLY